MQDQAGVCYLFEEEVINHKLPPRSDGDRFSPGRCGGEAYGKNQRNNKPFGGYERWSLQATPGDQDYHFTFLSGASWQCDDAARSACQSLTAGSRDEATVVPVASLVRRNDQRGIFLVDPQNMKARFVPVTLGIMSEDKAEVIQPFLSGLVVTLGQHLLEDGSAVSLQNEQQEIKVQSLADSLQPGEK